MTLCPEPLSVAEPADRVAAEEFLQLYYAEDAAAPGTLTGRLREVMREIDDTGLYTQTAAELRYGARVAWRNSGRCIGRLYWRSLRVRDRRGVTGGSAIAAELVAHLREATNGGRIRPTITVFAPAGPAGEIRIWNDQLVRYAGYTAGQGEPVIGDPANVSLTRFVRGLGWPGGPGTPFDLLPLAVQAPGECTALYELPADAVREVDLTHPRYPWFAGLGLRWYAVPAISSMCLEIGGLCYPAAPFNGWYMGTEIGARNLGDVGRYNLLPAVASRLGLDLSSERSLWRDRALVELNLAVLHSFTAAGVTITDHHTESHRFLKHMEREEGAGRVTPADWSWIVPPISGSATPVFHRYYDDVTLRPSYAYRSHCRRGADAADAVVTAAPEGARGGCPFVPGA
jgi:nitric-oxide synthase, bacterial